MSKYSKFKIDNTRFSKKQNEGHLYDSDDYLNEADGEGESSSENTGTKSEDQLRIEACKLSQKISKLMNNVSPADMLEIAEACLKYIKYQKAGEDYDPTYGLDDAEADTSDDIENNDSDSEDMSEDGELSFDDLDFGDEEDEFNADEKSEEKKNTEENDDEKESENEQNQLIPDEFII